ncbi:hypothetical protein [Chryseobacterium paridis]|uniref:Uncharacterized protein n=1 Tax=Chryseobacterium paridis TaxID=2800328 RepID=A0ABS1FVC2_9FLAO|nr:hypothetical protein [Chryseobacterium paridis]MBK1896395.1 hypothetical protein [Chryseobacterium paridis]
MYYNKKLTLQSKRFAKYTGAGIDQYFQVSDHRNYKASYFEDPDTAGLATV